MAHQLRVAVVSMVVGAAFLAPGPAAAAFSSPRLTIQNPSERVSGGGALTFRYSQASGDDAPYRVALYIPQGYITSLVQQPNTQIGSVAATAQGSAAGNPTLPLLGTLVSQPYTPAAYPQGAACAGTTTIDDVWEMRMTAAGQSFVVPVYVMTITSGPEALFAAGKLVFCLPSPYVPVEAGGAPAGAKLLTTEIRIRNVFTNPTSAGDYRWRAHVTPWTVGTATPNAAGAVETQALDKLPAQLTATATVNRVRRTVTIRGELRERSSRIAGAAVQLIRGARTLKVTRTNRLGRYTITVRLARGLHTLRTRATVPVRHLGRQQCVATAAFSGIPCVNVSLSGYQLLNNSPVRVRIR